MPFTAHWIGPDAGPAGDFGVHLFRRRLTLSEVPESLEMRVSADPRYKLFVNGRLVALGPAKGDLERWPYDIVDLAPALRTGENLIHAIVWNGGWERAFAEMSSRTAFLMDGDARLSTDERWETAPVADWRLVTDTDALGHQFACVGPGEWFDGTRQSDWTELAEDDRLPWRAARRRHAASEYGAMYEPEWALVPRAIPMMRYVERTRRPLLRASEETLPNAKTSAEKPLLLDFEELVNGYPRLFLEGAPGTVVLLTYVEAMAGPGNSNKGNRNEIEGKTAQGMHDRVTLGKGRTFWESLDWRCFRYIEVQVEGPGEATLADFGVVETGYPLRTAYRIELPDEPDAAKIVEVAERTLLRCMGETYFDCPYWERLQYVGDTRIQALLTYYLSTDRALPRQAIDLFGHSRRAEGFTQSRYPSRITQYIPPFALIWTLMRQDQRMYDRVVPAPDPGDPEPIDTEALDVANAVNRADDRHWWFCDWVDAWPNGVPPGGASSTVHRLTLFLAHAATERLLDLPTPEARVRAEALWRYMSLRLTFDGGWVRHRDDKFWQPTEHAESLYRILQRRLLKAEDAWPEDRPDAVRATLYFQHYVHETKPFHPSLLDPWREQLRLGLTTFAEKEEPTRSDCHAWSAHPLLTFFRRVAGVTSAAPGWRAARIAPDPGPYQSFDATIPHPDGPLSVRLEDGHLNIQSPIPFVLQWQGKESSFDGGRHRI